MACAAGGVHVDTKVETNVQTARAAARLPRPQRLMVQWPVFLPGASSVCRRELLEEQGQGRTHLNVVGGDNVVASEHREGSGRLRVEYGADARASSAVHAVAGGENPGERGVIDAPAGGLDHEGFALDEDVDVVADLAHEVMALRSHLHEVHVLDGEHYRAGLVLAAGSLDLDAHGLRAPQPLAELRRVLPVRIAANGGEVAQERNPGENQDEEGSHERLLSVSDLSNATLASVACEPPGDPREDLLY